MAATVIRIARANASWPSVASRPARWGSSEVWIDWNSCSGARAMSRTLKTMPASAASAAVASTVSTAALSSVCSASMIPATASAKPAGSRLAASLGPRLARPPRVRRSAHGMTISETNGAAAMPSATASWPSAIPTATSDREQKREIDSMSTSPP